MAKALGKQAKKIQVQTKGAAIKAAKPKAAAKKPAKAPAKAVVAVKAKPAAVKVAARTPVKAGNQAAALSKTKPTAKAVTKPATKTTKTAAKPVAKATGKAALATKPAAAKAKPVKAKAVAKTVTKVTKVTKAAPLVGKSKKVAAQAPVAAGSAQLKQTKAVQTKPAQAKLIPTKVAQVTPPAPAKATPVRDTVTKVKTTATKLATKLVEAKKSDAKTKAAAAPVVTTPKKVVTVKVTASTLAKLPPVHVAPLAPVMPEPEPPKRTVSPAAVRAFENAVKMFNRQNYSEAKLMFEALHQKFPQEGEILGRARDFMHALEKKLIGSLAATRLTSADDFYDQGVYALNVGNFPQAKEAFEKALKINPNEPHVLYSLAAAHAQTGKLDEALECLRRAIEVKPRFRSQAYDDSDFSALRENRTFQELLGLTSPFDLLGR